MESLSRLIGRQWYEATARWCPVLLPSSDELEPSRSQGQVGLGGHEQQGADALEFAQESTMELWRDLNSPPALPASTEPGQIVLPTTAAPSTDQGGN